MLLHSFKSNILLYILIILFSIDLCFANTVETQLSHEQITLDDAVVVTYILNNNTINTSPDFSVLQKDFQILKTDYGNTVNMVNGVTSMQTFWQLRLKPKKTGDLLVPAINFGNDKSQAHKLVVTVGSPKTQTIAQSMQQNVPVFVRGEINTTTPYVQSQALYTFKLYFRDQLIDPRIDIPPSKDMTFLPFGDHPGYQTTINGNVYNVAERKFAIFPKKPGKIVLSPMQFHAFTIDDNINTYADPFNFNEPKAISLATNNINLSVRDVPQNYPATTWLPAKNITLTEQWSDNEKSWEVGTPVTRTITIEALGLLADQLPDISVDKINGVNVYIDKAKRNYNVKNDNVIGVLQQKITYIPHTKQSFTVPPIKINWWNTQTDSNAVAELREMNIQVKDVVAVSHSPANAIPTQVLAPTNTAKTMQETEIISNTFYTSIWFWIACALLVAWLVTLWSMRRNKSINTNEVKTHIHASIEVSDKQFEQACRANQAIEAQQYLINWAKTQWPNVVLNLATLRELIDDGPFQLAIQELEQALYARKPGAWDGKTLLTAFQRMKKARKYSVAANKHVLLPIDPLPPLNP